MFPKAILIMILQGPADGVNLNTFQIPMDLAKDLAICNIFTEHSNYPAFNSAIFVLMSQKFFLSKSLLCIDTVIAAAWYFY